MRCAAVPDKDEASGAHPYAGRTAALATMHGKERVIGPAFAGAVGLDLVVPPQLDTDVFGTFSGEVARRGAMFDVAVRKARAGMARSGLPIGVASEGSFSPHPLIGVLPAGIELMVLVDDERGLVVSESFVSFATNFDRMKVTPRDALGAFLARAKFPTHAMVVRPHVPKADGARPWKGVADLAVLRRAIERASDQSADGTAVVETDMRAHVNPTRMEAIATLARRLAERVARLCGHCGSPGYDVVERKPGLACLACGTPTSLIASEVLGCNACGASEERSPAHGLAGASTLHCPSCNP